ncbi:unnamed protein product, partial [Protopolystoma xenopodis]
MEDNSSGDITPTSSTGASQAASFSTHTPSAGGHSESDAVLTGPITDSFDALVVASSQSTLSPDDAIDKSVSLPDQTDRDGSDGWSGDVTEDDQNGRENDDNEGGVEDKWSEEE